MMSALEVYHFVSLLGKKELVDFISAYSMLIVQENPSASTTNVQYDTFTILLFTFPMIARQYCLIIIYAN